MADIIVSIEDPIFVDLTNVDPAKVYSGTIEVGTVTTLDPGEDATVVNSGTLYAAEFDFGIPQGDPGTPGAPGAAATIAAGSVTTLAAGSPATVVNSGSSSAAVFDFGIPQGIQGIQGISAETIIIVLDPLTLLATGDSQAIIPIPLAWNGKHLVTAHARVDTASSSGLPTIQLRRVSDSIDLLSTPITIDATELSSYTALTPPVCDVTKLFVTGDGIAVDCDLAGTGTYGLAIILTAN